MDRELERGRDLQTSALDTEDMGDRTAVTARRWIRAHSSLLAALEQTFGDMALPDSAKAIYERRIEDSREHIRYWREVLAQIGAQDIH